VSAIEQERWRRIEQIFLQAAEVPRAERDAFLRDACGDDPALRQEVESLLQGDEATGDVEPSTVIAGIIGDAAAGLFDMTDAVIGNYLRHENEVNDYLRGREAEAEALEKEIRAAQPAEENLRAKLLTPRPPVRPENASSRS